MNTDAVSAGIMNTPVIGVAIGLMLIYLTGALVASAAKEAIAAVFQWRGTYLQKGIGVLLSNAPNTAFAWGGIFEFLKAHVTWMDPTCTPSTAVAAATEAADAAAKAVGAAKAAVAASTAAATTPGPDAAAAAANANQ